MVGELFALASAVENKLTKAIFGDKAVQFWVNSFKLGKAIKTQNLYILYSIGFSKAKIRLKNGSKMIIFLDINTKIDVMTWEIMEDIKLTI